MSLRSDYPMSAFSLFTLCFLSLGLLGLIVCKGRKRAFWGGAWICGWVYLIPWHRPSRILPPGILTFIVTALEDRIPDHGSRVDFAFHAIHYFVACLLGLIGGYIARWLFDDTETESI